MTETKRPLKVFLCHAHSDKETVKALYTRLTKDGVDAWLDKENSSIIDLLHANAESVLNPCIRYAIR